MRRWQAVCGAESLHGLKQASWHNSGEWSGMARPKGSEILINWRDFESQEPKHLNPPSGGRICRKLGSGAEPCRGLPVPSPVPRPQAGPQLRLRLSEQLHLWVSPPSVCGSLLHDFSCPGPVSCGTHQERSGIVI